MRLKDSVPVRQVKMGEKGPLTAGKGGTPYRGLLQLELGGRSVLTGEGGGQTTQAQEKEFSSRKTQSCYMDSFGGGVRRVWMVTTRRPEYHRRWKTVSSETRLGMGVREGTLLNFEFFL